MTDSLEFAHESAVTLHTTTVFCPKKDNTSCGTNWQNGQLILDVHNQRVLRILPAIPAGYALDWRSTLGDSADLRFRSDGFTRGQQGSFFICNQKNAAFSAKMVILRTGRVRVVTGNIAECDA